MSQRFSRECWTRKNDRNLQGSENRGQSFLPKWILQLDLRKMVAKKVMNLESQVCSLELAKRCKELKVKQESIFCWVDFGDLDYFIQPTTSTFKGEYAAFTASELGEILPEQILSVRLGFYDKDKNYTYNWSSHETPEDGMEFLAKTEANARAKMLIYLIEKGIMKL